MGASRGILDSCTRRGFLPSLGRIAFSPALTVLSTTRSDKTITAAGFMKHRIPCTAPGQQVGAVGLSPEYDGIMMRATARSSLAPDTHGDPDFRKSAPTV